MTLLSRLPLAVTLCTALALPALAADNPRVDDGVLTIPLVDTPELVGQFHDARLERQPDGRWRLAGVEALRSPRIELAGVGAVEVVKTTGFPVAVYLRASGTQLTCGYDGLARVAQRRVGDRFEVSIGVRHTDQATEQLLRGTIACTADVRPFRMTVPLAVYGLAAGTYRYTVNGVSGSFTLDRDNRHADDCDAGAPAERHLCR